MTLPMAPPITSANGSAVFQSPRGVFASHHASSPQIAAARTTNRYCCQPLASLRKLNAAPVL
jgi:hypothetical protein